MKKIGILGLLLISASLLTGCHENIEVIDDSIFPEDCTENSSIETTDISDYFSAFGTEPYRDFEISGGIAKLISVMYDTNYETAVNIWKEGENFYFTGEELEGEFIKKDCIDGGKGDLHYYTVGVAKFREYSYEGCGDINGKIKMTNEEYEATLENNFDEIILDNI